MPDTSNQQNCRRKRSGAERNEDLQYNNDNVSTTESADEYSYDSYPDEYNYDDLNADSEDCNNLGIYNGSIVEDTQTNLYKDLPRNIYCELIDTLETQCFEQSLLEIWMYKEEVINKLSTEDIIYAVNKLERSPYFGFKYNYSKLLGSIQRNETGHIISAKATLYNLITVVNFSKIKYRTFLRRSGPQTIMDEANIKWQDEGIKIALDLNSNSTITGISWSPFSQLLLSIEIPTSILG